jgi:hypothetical protein
VIARGSRGVLLPVAPVTKQQHVAEGKERCMCMHAKENKIDDISHMQH